MEIKIEINNIYDLLPLLYSGADDTVKTLMAQGKADELLDHLEEMFSSETPTLTDVNDFLRYDSSEIFSSLGLDEDGEPFIDLEDDEDITITPKYLNYLEEHFSDYNSTYLNYKVIDIYKNIMSYHVNGEERKDDYTHISIEFTPDSLNTENITETFTDEELTGLIQTILNTYSRKYCLEPVNKPKQFYYTTINSCASTDLALETIKKGGTPITFKVECNVLYRCLTDDISSIFDFMDTLYNNISDYMDNIEKVW